MTLLAACATAACGKEEVKDPEKELPMTSSEYISFKVSATSPSEETVITWEAVSDRIGVFVSDAGTGSALNDNAYYDAFTSTSSSRFFPLKDADKLKWEEGKKYDVALYYPFSVKMKDAASIPVSVDEDQTVPIPLTSMQLKKEQLFVSSLKSVERPDNGILEMALSPVVSFVKINVSSNLPVACKSIKITGEDGTALAFKHGKYDLFTSGLSEIDSVSSVINVKPASPVYLSRKPAEFIVNVNPQYAGKTLKIKCDLEGADFEEVTVDIPEGGLKPGVCVSYNVGMTADPVLLSSNGTANTYIVNKADCLYAFNAKVKGNGKSGSFTWNFDGETCSKSNDASLSPSSAELLWYSIPEGENGFVNASPIAAGSVMYDEVDGLIYFKTPKTFIDGNAVIAALNESGEIVWSWNIWAVEGWNADATAKKAGRYTVMDRNLGAVLGLSAKDVSDNVKAAGAIGNYYQWGRKDPFPAASEYQTTTNVLSDWATLHTRLWMSTRWKETRSSPLTGPGTEGCSRRNSVPAIPSSRLWMSLSNILTSGCSVDRAMLNILNMPGLQVITNHVQLKRTMSGAISGAARTMFPMTRPCMTHALRDGRCRQLMLLPIFSLTDRCLQESMASISRTMTCISRMQDSARQDSADHHWQHPVK